MRSITCPALTALMATVALGAVVSGASARKLSVSNQNFRITWTSLELETTSGSGRILCPLTLEGTFSYRTIIKTLNSLIGYVTRAIVGTPAACRGGEATILTETLPWHVTYQGFTGRLPTIETIRILLVGFAFRYHVTGSLTCLAAASITNPARAFARLSAEGRITELTPDRTGQIPQTGEGGLCTFARLIFLENSGTLTLLGTNNAITVTLI